MTVRRVDTRTVTLPITRPTAMSTRALDRREFVLAARVDDPLTQLQLQLRVPMPCAHQITAAIITSLTRSRAASCPTDGIVTSTTSPRCRSLAGTVSLTV